ncbi:PPC domain-containing DNA-binding protein [Acidimangrovimonas sediminis]|uniref:PPC domain-containing DNA-binding protein n=1 Tax=Acidimangrovimonas sediminis TaxID=2056283 RepID=UPI001E2FB2E7|nr:PPC domain-containing DNA-binding protein [Acidimangrovimonas sediminis]
MPDRLSADWPGGATRHLGLRLLPGEDLRGALSAAFAKAPEAAGYLATCVGSLDGARIRPAGRDDALEISGNLEIVALSGTFSADGPHLHIAVADSEGRVLGGHLLAGCAVRTTAEVVIGLVSGVRFLREADARTGYAELFMVRNDGQD